jgi:hypothetical protein
MACIAAPRTPSNCGFPWLPLSRAHVWNVWLSHSAASLASHGASSGTDFDISLSCATTPAAPAITNGSLGTAPAGVRDENVDLRFGVLTPS